MTIEHDQLPVQLFKGAYAKVTMRLQIADRDTSSEDTFNQGSTGGNLKERMVSNIELVSNSSFDNV
jgi:hypothetical protein